MKKQKYMIVSICLVAFIGLCFTKIPWYGAIQLVSMFAGLLFYIIAGINLKADGKSAFNNMQIDEQVVVLSRKERRKTFALEWLLISMFFFVASMLIRGVSLDWAVVLLLLAGLSFIVAVFLYLLKVNTISELGMKSLFDEQKLNKKK